MAKSGLTYIQLGDYHKPPIIKANQRFEWIPFGGDNSYLEYLLALYQNSPTHRAIVEGKAKFIFGKGAEWVGAGKAKFDIIDKRFDAQTFIKCLVLDYELFNGFYFKARENKVAKSGLSELKHLPFRNLRVNRHINEFFFSELWTKEQALNEREFKPNKNPIDLITYPEFKPGEVYPGIAKYFSYDPAIKIYPLPQYMGGLAVIQTEVEINNFNLTSAKTMFGADAVVNIPVPEPDPGSPEARQYEGMFKNKFTGSDNAGEIILFYTGGGTEKMDVVRLGPSNLPDLYKELLPTVTQKIYSAHQVTSPMLFGERVEGQLGGRNEMLDAYELFENNYCKPRRMNVENYLTNFFNDLGIEGELKMIPQPPVTLQLSEATIVSVLTENEKRKMVGQYLNDPEIAKPIAKKVDPVLKALKQFDRIGITADEATFKSVFKAPRYETDAEYETFESTVQKMNFAKLDDLQSELLGLLVIKEDYRLDTLAEKTGANKDTVINALNGLQELNIIQYTTSGNPNNPTVTRDIINRVDTNTVEVRYRYWGPNDSKNRSFCKELLKKGKLYTRAELNKMKNPDGKSVWLHRGGWYHDPETGVNRDNCRHIWQAVII